jgi:hypothetical protein
LPVPRVEGEHLVAHLVRLGRELDVPSRDALQDLVVGQPLLRKLRNVVVAVDAVEAALKAPAFTAVVT